MLGKKLAERTSRAFPSYTYRDEQPNQWEGVEIPPDTIRLDNLDWPAGFRLPEHVVSAAVKAAEKGSEYVLDRNLELRRAIAEKLERDNGLSVNPEDQILVTNGASEAMFLSVWALVNPGDDAIFADPGYVCGWAPNVLMSGGKMVYVPVRLERNFRLDPTEIEESITNRTKLIAISAPDQPTGAVPDKQDLEEIASIAIDQDLIVVYDESFENISYCSPYPGSLGALPGMEDRTITINGFAKNYNMPGYRIGYVAGPRDFIERIAGIQSHTTVCAGDIAQAAALAVLTGPQDWVRKYIQDFKSRRDLLVGCLNKIEGIRSPYTDGYFGAFTDISSFGLSSRDFARYLLKEARVKVACGRKGFWGDRSEGFVSVAFSGPTESQIIEGVDRIRSVLEERRSLVAG